MLNEMQAKLGHVCAMRCRDVSTVYKVCTQRVYVYAVHEGINE
jgi:hypothetical protein